MILFKISVLLFVVGAISGLKHDVRVNKVEKTVTIALNKNNKNIREIVDFYAILHSFKKHTKNHVVSLKGDSAKIVNNGKTVEFPFRNDTKKFVFFFVVEDSKLGPVFVSGNANIKEKQKVVDKTLTRHRRFAPYQPPSIEYGIGLDFGDSSEEIVSSKKFNLHQDPSHHLHHGFRRGPHSNSFPGFGGFANFPSESFDGPPSWGRRNKHRHHNFNTKPDCNIGFHHKKEGFPESNNNNGVEEVVTKRSKSTTERSVTTEDFSEDETSSVGPRSSTGFPKIDIRFNRD